MPPAPRRRYVRRRNTTRRRTYRRPYRRYKQRSYRPVRLSTSVGFPRKMLVKLRYNDVQQLTIDTSGGALTRVVNYQYQTSLYDPDLTSLGHQPMYYDQLMQPASIYGKYRVYGIRYEFWFMNTNTNQLMPVCIYHSATSNVVTTTSWNLVEEQTGMRAVNVGPLNTKATYVRGYLDLAKTLGCTKRDVRTEDDFEAVYNANPARMGYLAVYASSFNASASNILNMRVRLTYYAELSSLFNQALS